MRTRFAAALGISLGLIVSPVAVSAGDRAYVAHDPLAAIDMNRTAIVGDIVKAFAADDADHLRTRLQKLRADRLLAASLASSRGSLMAILDGDGAGTPASEGPSPKFTPPPPPPPPSRMMYTPLSPCRLVDTRGFAAPIQGGAFLPNTRRAYAPAGQCAVPTTDVYSLVISFTTENLTPVSGGYLAILSPGALVTTSVDVFNLGSEWSASNTVVATGTAGQFDVYVAAATAHVVIDILGYFTPIAIAGSDITDGTITAAKLAAGTVPAGPAPTFAFAATPIATGATAIGYSGICAAGTNVISGICSATGAPMALIATGFGVNQWTCTYRNDSGAPQTINVNAVCLPAYAAPK